jgi:hypothetical protein
MSRFGKAKVGLRWFLFHDGLGATNRMEAGVRIGRTKGRSGLLVKYPVASWMRLGEGLQRSVRSEDERRLHEVLWALGDEQNRLKRIGHRDGVNDVVFGNPNLIVTELVGKHSLLDEFGVQLLSVFGFYSSSVRPEIR